MIFTTTPPVSAKPGELQLITPSSSQAEVYVNLTRGRHENAAVMVEPMPPSEDEPHLPRLPRQQLLTAVAHGVRSRSGERSAIDVRRDATPSI
jgi:hypothetical protein